MSTDLYRLGSGTLTAIRNWDEILGLTVRPTLVHGGVRQCSTSSGESKETGVTYTKY